ncbi:MAG: hypothetical protein IJS39_11570 [Synergistaceae bacterium]|nr:hypothetical protein [Synergistaceae bacterium]
MRDVYSFGLPAVRLGADSGAGGISPEVITWCAVVYALAVSMSREYSALAAASVLPVILLFRHKIPLLKLNIMNLVMIITMAMTWPDVSEGALLGTLTALRVNMIYIVFCSLVFPLGMNAVYSLRLPEKLRVMLILTLRGIFILSERLEKALISVRLRAPEVRGMMRLKVFAYVLGSVLLKSADHSEKMMLAAEARGGFGGFAVSENRRFGVRDMVLVGSCIGYAVLIVLLNYA